jgi:DNA-binding transcriptional LysR family regulator
MLDVRRMRVLREVAERGSIAGAAQALAFTPSAISQQIATLERETGLALVERGPRSIRLTDAGRVLVAHTEGILASLEAAEADIQAIAGLRAGLLRLASFPTAYATVMPPALVEFRRRHAAVELTLTEADPKASLARVKSGELDLALAYEYDYVPVEHDDALAEVDLFDDAIRVLVPNSHPAARRRAVRLEELSRDVWITSTERSSCHAFVARACEAAGFSPQIGFESDDYSVWQGLVASGMGVALAPDLALVSVHPDVVVRPVALQPLRRRVFAVHRAGGLSPAIAAMLEVLTTTSSAWRREAGAIASAS